MSALSSIPGNLSPLLIVAVFLRDFIFITKDRYVYGLCAGGYDMVCGIKDISHMDTVKDTNARALHGIIPKVAKSKRKKVEVEALPIKRGRGCS